MTKLRVFSYQIISPNDESEHLVIPVKVELIMSNGLGRSRFDPKLANIVSMRQNVLNYEALVNPTRFGAIGAGNSRFRL
jgi:hypothetical protein